MLEDGFYWWVDPITGKDTVIEIVTKHQVAFMIGDDQAIDLNRLANKDSLARILNRGK